MFKCIWMVEVFKHCFLTSTRLLQSTLYRAVRHRQSTDDTIQILYILDRAHHYHFCMTFLNNILRVQFYLFTSMNSALPALIQSLLSFTYLLVHLLCRGSLLLLNRPVLWCRDLSHNSLRVIGRKTLKGAPLLRNL